MTISTINPFEMADADAMAEHICKVRATHPPGTPLVSQTQIDNAIEFAVCMQTGDAVGAELAIGEQVRIVRDGE